MRAGTAAALAILAAACAPTVAAVDVRWDLVGHSEGSLAWFTLGGAGERNPTLAALEGDRVNVTLISATGVHNVRFGKPVNLSTRVAGRGNATLSLAFTAPAGVSNLNYWCDPHARLGMGGTVEISRAEVGRASSALGFGGVALAVAGGVALARRRTG